MDPCHISVRMNCYLGSEPLPEKPRLQFIQQKMSEVVQVVVLAAVAPLTSISAAVIISIFSCVGSEKDL